MTFTATRRRFLALAGLFTSAAVTRAGAAGSTNKLLLDEIGTWRYEYMPADDACDITLIPDRMKVSSAVDSAGHTGSAVIAIKYSPNPDHHSLTGMLDVKYDGGAAAATVYIDGAKVGSFHAGGQGQNLSQWFGTDLQKIVDAKTMKVVLDLSGGPLTVFDVAFDQTKPAFEAAVNAGDSDYAWYHDIVIPSGGGTAGGGNSCFLTTACCEVVGLADDCFELATLRRFRDEVMMESADGRADVARYYAEAPVIVAAIHRRGERRVLLGLYFTHILPSALAAQIGLKRTARRLYTNMMHRLAPYVAA